MLYLLQILPFCQRFEDSSISKDEREREGEDQVKQCKLKGIT